MPRSIHRGLSSEAWLSASTYPKGNNLQTPVCKAADSSVLGSPGVTNQCWVRLISVPSLRLQYLSGFAKQIFQWIFIGRTDAEAEAPILWPPAAKGWLIGKDPDTGKDWGQEEKEMAGWHHRLSGHEFEQTLGDGEGQESLACCSPRGRQESDITEWLNDNRTNLWGS